MVCWDVDVLIILLFHEVFVTEHCRRKTSGLSQHTTIRGTADVGDLCLVWSWNLWELLSKELDKVVIGVTLQVKLTFYFVG